ncbi:amino acid ABC transporter permease [Pollutimonas thiosulfatoxidans]|uniref:Glutamate/aspartate import permease protein GltK n=1 Tax=Pollutimonas thiosulfatoxidans TaxID=2028345 RepID=A0A410GD23_9BURK|nr:amino acid ABC transporter permease [Pollutimonas thiosulfatoxidans]MBF6616434.1 amino acid ABC transporter permease [Candidimonas sp.]NYT43932.1 amino acid ABC transporter permease [Alcaligenaceae bacterium]QAA94190.1 amino acid ABC transporter permease [Pollutimonas thiosulfatoxidans]
MSGFLEIIDTYWLYFLVGQYPYGPLGGLALTVILASLALVLALPLGVVLAFARISPWRAVRWPVSALVFVVRGTPLLMVVFWAYFFLPSVTGVKTDQFTTMLIALVVFDAAYLAEIIRAGIQGLPKGQMESARSLGLGYFRAMRLVVLPQALRNMLPSLVNQFVSTIKETSLGYIIGLAEVSFITSQINTQVMVWPAQIYLVLGLTYFTMCFGLGRFAYWLERRLSRRAIAAPLQEVSA